MLLPPPVTRKGVRTVSAYVILVIPPEEAAELPVLKRVLAPIVLSHRGQMLADGIARHISGSDSVERATCVIEFPDAAAAKGWLTSGELSAALTPVEAAVLFRAVIVESLDRTETSTAMPSIIDAVPDTDAKVAPGPHSPEPAERPAWISPTGMCLLALAGLAGCVLIAPSAARQMPAEVRYMFALFSSCFLLALAGWFRAERSRAGASATAVAVVMLATLITALIGLSTPSTPINMAAPATASAPVLSRSAPATAMSAH